MRREVTLRVRTRWWLMPLVAALEWSGACAALSPAAFRRFTRWLARHGTRLAAALLLAAAPALAQPTASGLAARAFPVQVTVANLPDATTGSHGMRIVTDDADCNAATVDDAITACLDTGSTWGVVGSSVADDDVPEVGDFGALALSGDVTSVGLATTIAAGAVSADELDEAGVEAGLEAVLDLSDLQGAVTDAQVPDTITASNYLPLAGGTLTGAFNIDNAQAFKLFEADAQGAHSWALTAPDLTADATCTIAADGRIPDSCVGDGTDGGGAPGGLDTYCQFNDGGAFGGDAGCTYNKTTDSLTLGGHVVLSGNQFLYTLGIGDNWRLGASVESGAVGGHNYLIRDKATGYVQYITFGPSGGQGFAIGSIGVGTALEIEAVSRIVYLHTALQLKPRSAPPVTCGAANTSGVVYTDSDSAELCFCDGTSWTGLKAGGACA